MLFTDEAWLHLRDYINSQNSQIRSTVNAHVLHETPLHSQEIGVWCAISQCHIVGPIFFETTVNGVAYIALLDNN